MSEINFIDHVKINAKSGNGGAGSAHFRREKFIEKGGPDGGDGGRGGHIILKGNRNLWTLFHLRYQKHIKAEKGQSGSGNCKTGAQGEDIIIEVPLGTIAKNDENNEKLAEIVTHGEEKIILEGGKGGLGNVHFKSSTRQSPQYAQPGLEGVEAWVVLELKVLADVGLVGFPNAGKSTFLSVVSNAKPKIADYPFTTIKPNLGVVPYEKFKSFIVADIPGIIEGAAEGKGIGLRFLRHIERNSLLLFMIPGDSLEIKTQYNALINELKKYNPELLDKDRILAITKLDLLDNEVVEELKNNIPENIPHIFISSATQTGITELKHLIWKLLNKHNK